ncbi:hypothetical protein MKS88_005427 [Plasmodium brasilianum]|uniref:Uncharacterized protein n=2 Tax=Plasmodium (Plasmodium) TaxID=418103 RepID=A0A1A8WGP4_PLAMA|nr:conserved Plasmodium protein, unknown function [Plasmodium malariae]KAI4834748.1 hypothetical protein MKS88_005427 [Plasmodium brasilianum]SBS90366.1 hypothetical protein PMALA_029500 [Plasmodium malariae]SCP03305.1 conserved Plasmodium protein, unknown function [Plasmodium malariae]
MAKSNIEIAKQLKHNSVEIKEYFEDLYAWQNEIRKKEEKEKGKEKKREKEKEKSTKEGKSKGKISTAKKDDATNLIKEERKNCEIRNVKKGSEEINIIKTSNFNQNSSLKRDCNSLDDYYRAWEKLIIENVEDGIENKEKNSGNSNINSNNAESLFNHCEIRTNEQERKGSNEIAGVGGKNEDVYSLQTDISKSNYTDAQVCSDYKLKEDGKWSLNLNKEEQRIVKVGSRAFDIFICKSEEGKINYQNRRYNKCLENYNDIISYIDYELRSNNVFLEIEKNYDNELYIDVMSCNYVLENKNIEELCILRTKALINRALAFQRVCSYFEGIQDCSCVILFYTYFLPRKKDSVKYSIKNLLTVNIKNIIFKAYYLRAMARYKLKIYKHSLADFKNSKDLTNDINCSTTINIDKSIQLLENIIKENNIKKHIRRQSEYTSTLLERYKLKSKMLRIEIIQKKYTRELGPPENNSTNGCANNNNGCQDSTKKDSYDGSDRNNNREHHNNSENNYNSNNSNSNSNTLNCSSERVDNLGLSKEHTNGVGITSIGGNKKIIKVKKGEERVIRDIVKNEQNSKEHGMLYTVSANKIVDRVEKVKEEMEDEKNNNASIRNISETNKKQNNNIFNSEDINSDSSLTLSENEILSDLEETRPGLLTAIPSIKNCENIKIKNKINFEIIWNSDKVKSSFKNQLNILKIAFLEEGIFHFNLDKDIYVDILDCLFKNNFLVLFQNMDNEEEIMQKLQGNNHENDPCFTYVKNGTNEDGNSVEFNGCIKNGNVNKGLKNNRTAENGEELNSNDCVILIDILYMLTNRGKENYIFLFVDKKERALLLKFFSFIFKYPNVFICNENCIKEKTLLLKSLLEMIF